MSSSSRDMPTSSPWRGVVQRRSPPYLKSAIAGDVDLILGSCHIEVAVILAILALTHIARIEEGAEPFPERNAAVYIPSQMSDGGVAEIRGIDTLRQQREGVEKVQILRIVVESEHRLYLATANPEPRFESVVGKRPVERRMPTPELAQIAVVNLSAHAEPVRNLRGGVHPGIREFTAANISGVHGQPVVSARVDESLRGEPVDLDFPVKEFEVLRMQTEPDCAETNR